MDHQGVISLIQSNLQRHRNTVSYLEELQSQIEICNEQLSLLQPDDELAKLYTEHRKDWQQQKKQTEIEKQQVERDIGKDVLQLTHNIELYQGDELKPDFVQQLFKANRALVESKDMDQYIQDLNKILQQPNRRRSQQQQSQSAAASSVQQLTVRI